MAAKASERDNGRVLWTPFGGKAIDDTEAAALQRLLDEGVEENLFLEYKGKWEPHQIAKSIAAFANTEGGTLIVGSRLRIGGLLPSSTSHSMGI